MDKKYRGPKWTGPAAEARNFVREVAAASVVSDYLADTGLRVEDLDLETISRMVDMALEAMEE